MTLYIDVEMGVTFWPTRHVCSILFVIDC